MDIESSIAVVGMAAHLPGAREVAHFWGNLREGVESIRRFSDEELEGSGVEPSLLEDPNYVKASGVLDEMEWFDAGFFGMSPRDAAVMDPQTRHFLECVWHGLEHSGHVPERFDGTIGVFAGAGATKYFWKNVVADPDLMRSVGFFLLRHTGNDKDFLATRASYEFDLTGPSIGIQTACSTSLVAIHYACQSLLGWECDMALAGGVTIEQPHVAGYLYKEGEILSPDGHCRSFDHGASGTVFGSGAGVVVLRRLADALESRDTVHAIIRGSAINNDGSGKVSYLAPSVDGQAKAIAEALSVAGVGAETIGLVEAHGTATPIGDPIEVAALTQAFRAHTDAVGYCALGSVKSNIGHLDTAAGVASFIKAVCAVKHAEIPPTLHFEQPNPLLELDSSPFYVNAEVKAWPETGIPRRAGVSSVGVGGTNAHVVIEEAPRSEPTSGSEGWQLLTLSGRSPAVVEDVSRELLDFLDENPRASLADVSYTLRNGRRRFKHRRALVCRSHDQVIEALATGNDLGLSNEVSEAERRDVAFLFAGGGAQYPNMGRELYEAEPVFRESADRCIEHFATLGDFDLRALLYPDPDDEEHAEVALQRPSRALPALFTTQLAQAHLWMSWGVHPSAMVGHSMGEYTAACLAGVFQPEDGVALVHKRGQLFETLERGGMLSVSLSEDELRERMVPTLSVAAVNAPEASVASGPVEAIEELEKELTAKGVDCRRIRIDVAAHSSMLEPILADFDAFLQRLGFSEPRIPVISNVTGRVAGAEMAESDYWVRHLRETVRFSEGLGQLLRPDGPLLLEVGPGRTLATLARMHGDWNGDQAALHSLPHPGERSDAQAFQFATLGALWAHGADPDWSAFDEGTTARRIPLPGYPFEREPHFVSAPEPEAEQGGAASHDRARGDSRPEGAPRQDDPAAWFHQTKWLPTAFPPASEMCDGPILVLADLDSPGERLANRLADLGNRMVRVRRGASFTELGPDEYALQPGCLSDWNALFAAMQSAESLPAVAVHAWSLDRNTTRDLPLKTRQDETFFGPLWLIQALETTAPGHPLRFLAVTSETIAVTGAEPVRPYRALLHGPMRVAPRELPSLETRLVDVGSLPDDPTGESRVLDLLAREILSPSEQTVVAHRGRDRLVEHFTSVPIGPGEHDGGLRDGGVYLITGGLGGIGLVLARELAVHTRARLALVGRTALPEGSDRIDWLASHDTDDKVSRAIREVERIEELGVEVMTFSADVTDGSQMTSVVGSVVDRFGTLNGVIHTAGVLDDGPLLARTEEQALAVLSPKVEGTDVLLHAIDGIDVDFVILFSSLSAVLGAPGQVDYTAANAYLDATARSHQERTGRKVLSIGWGAWKDVGMAAELAGEARYDLGGEGGEDVVDREGSFFDTEALYSDGARGFRVRFARGVHWMLDEHRVRNGMCVLPGSAYVELIRTAFSELAPAAPFALEGLVFLSPFSIDEEDERELEVRFVAEGEGWNVVVRARLGGSAWFEHATALVVAPIVNGRSFEALSTVLDRVGDPQVEVRASDMFMDFGPRWNNVTATATRSDEALLAHSLPGEFTGDLGSAQLHPALLDMATAGAQHLIEGFDRTTDFMVPAGYGSLLMRSPLSSELTSHIRLRSADKEAGLASFDVTVYGSDGAVAVDVRDFSMIRIRGDALSESDPDPGSGQPAWLRHAINPDEGCDVFHRIMTHHAGPHILVATRSLDALIEEASHAQLRTARVSAAKRLTSRSPVPEVASVLETHGVVREAATLGSHEEGHPSRIVAFVVFEPGQQATVSELRRFTREKLGRDLTPQNFVEMVVLPRNGDGSIAFEELRDPLAPEDTHVAPRTTTEEVIASIWSELLGLGQVSVYDNFLDVGGHSLVGIRVLLRIHQATGVRLEANALTLQTLEQLAADVDRVAGATR